MGGQAVPELSVSCSCSRNTLSVLFLGASEVDFQKAQVGLDLLSMSARMRPGAISPTLHVLHEATETGPDSTRLSSGALSVENKDYLPSRQPKHRQSKTLDTSAPGLSVPEKEKSENDYKVSTFCHLVLVSLKEKCS